MSGSPQGVFGWTQPFGVSMKWFASLGGPRTDCVYVVAAKRTAAAVQLNTLRIAGIIRCMVTPVAPANKHDHGTANVVSRVFVARPAYPNYVTRQEPCGQDPSFVVRIFVG